MPRMIAKRCAGTTASTCRGGAGSCEQGVDRSNSMNASRQETVSERAFRNALGMFPTGVVVITALSGGARLGLTVSSFSSVSLAPPLVLFSVAKRAFSFASWQTVDRYAINILSEDQVVVSNRFASSSSGGDKFEGVPVLSGTTGVPILPNVLAALECTAYAR